mmetsp:Transcript_29589/g.65520  ORF Transcript_29589/g.65520 Transcript_29589/m.65520 type:complete len:219 (+) Transcript_29589:776-1432(+)
MVMAVYNSVPITCCKFQQQNCAVCMKFAWPCSRRRQHNTGTSLPELYVHADQHWLQASGHHACTTWACHATHAADRRRLQGDRRPTGSLPGFTTRSLTSSSGDTSALMRAPQAPAPALPVGWPCTGLLPLSELRAPCALLSGAAAWRLGASRLRGSAGGRLYVTLGTGAPWWVGGATGEARVARIPRGGPGGAGRAAAPPEAWGTACRYAASYDPVGS